MEGNESDSIIRNQISPASTDIISNGDLYGSASPTGRESNYVEFMGGSVPCPTCRGVGSIPKEQEGQLVALIPLKDDRLKPRRTYLYVGLAVFICLLAAGLLLFFLLPRNVTIESNKPLLLPLNLTIDTAKEYVSFIIVNKYNLTNSNYITVSVSNIEMTVMFDRKIINTTEVKNGPDVPIRSNTVLEVPIRITFDDNNGLSFMAGMCANKVQWYHQNIMIFQTTVSYSYLGHTEDTTLATYQYVSCGNDTKPAKD